MNDIFTTSDSLSLVNMRPKPVSGLTRLKSGMMGLRLVTQPPAATVLKTAAALTINANTTQPSSPMLTMSLRRCSMLAWSAMTRASNDSCWTSWVLSWPNNSGDSVSTPIAPTPSTARLDNSLERVT